MTEETGQLSLGNSERCPRTELGEFLRKLSSTSMKDVFNPYSDRCPIFDLEDAPSQRLKLIRKIVEQAQRANIDTIWIGRDLGYRGGRRTGLALTDDMHLENHLKRWDVQLIRPTVGDMFVERTATVIWSVLNNIPYPVFLWNLFPFHPHYPDEPFSNRPHTMQERKIGLELLNELICLLAPNRIVAIGNDAHNGVVQYELDIEVIKVRHPSYGGQKQFVSMISEIYKLNPI